ncbi:MAG: porin, partial [Isosphaeraceae bacterium]|nr:porin [Isosphaeraceae bacterium]
GGGGGAAPGAAPGGAITTTVAGGGARPTEREAQDIGNRRLGRIPLKASYNYNREGFQIESDSQELQLKVRAEFQADDRIYNRDMNPVQSGFYLPRTRFYFQGYFTRPLEYQISFQEGYGSFAPLNVFLNLHYDDRIQLRVGRFKAPYTYEWYRLNNWRFIGMERSLFPLNFGLNRMLGLMGWGELFEKRLEYAVGVFDGPRNSFQDYNSAKDIISFFNFKPWQTREGFFLQNLNLGGSVDYGYQNNPLTPAALRTSANASSSGINSGNPVDNAAVPFLAFNSDVRERGLRALWELHAAYYYKGLSLIGAWDSGFDSYALNAPNSRPVALPLNGWFVQAAYLLTGETVMDRAVYEPIRRFDLRPGKFGLGAWEVHGRYSELDIGRQVFTSGFADPNLWTNRVQMVDVGVNWYLNKWVVIKFVWEHPIFAQPVYYKPGPFLQSSSDLFWFRFQVYY